MPSANLPGALVNTSERAPASPGMGPSRAARARRRSARPNTRHVGEVCPLIVLMMPFGVPEWGAFRLRKWLRKRLGRRVGNAVGRVFLTAARVPMVVPVIVFWVAGHLWRRTIGKEGRPHEI